MGSKGSGSHVQGCALHTRAGKLGRCSKQRTDVVRCGCSESSGANRFVGWPDGVRAEAGDWPLQWERDGRGLDEGTHSIWNGQKGTDSSCIYEVEAARI